jgi:hypothetical protein
MKTNLLRSLQSVFIQVGALVMALTWFSSQAQAGTTLPPVGPTPPGVYDKVSCGYLEVFSATQESQWGEGSTYYPHTGYRIYNSSGKMVKWVENHNTSIDEAPQKVELTPGTYTVWALSDKDGYVNVPVVIKLAQVTKVHLENGRDSDKEAINPARAVTTPSGQVVGWKA